MQIIRVPVGAFITNCYIAEGQEPGRGFLVDPADNPKKLISILEEKQNDAFLATDCIATEKLVSGEYNTDVFVFGESGVRKLLADIQVEEQNHAEMLYKYKMANGMS